MTDPTPREQAVEAAQAVMVARLPGWGDYTRETPEAVVAAVWPLAERAALDRAEKALRTGHRSVRYATGKVTHGGPVTYADGCSDECRERCQAADLVASLRPEEPE